MKFFVRLTGMILLTLLVQSCFKEDEMVTPHPRGQMKSDTIAMTENYLNQVYYSFDSARAVRSVVKTTYDLGFECSNSGWHIILNTSDFMKVVDLGTVEFGQTYDTTGMKKVFDKSDGNPDSTAIGEWYSVNGQDTVSKNHIYAVSRGMDELGNKLGLFQLIIDSLKHGTYYFRYAPLAGGPGTAGAVSKQYGINYRYFSLKSGVVVNVEPPRDTWDVVFTQYTTLLYTDKGEPYPYLVTGVLLNRNSVEATSNSQVDFFSITKEKALAMQLSTALDAIGYDWKSYSFTTGVYTVQPGVTYVVRTVFGQYFKLRFAGFYNSDGLKGYPIIEFQVLS